MPSINKVARTAILQAAQNRRIESFMARYGMRLGAARFVSGQSLDEGMAVVRQLNGEGFKCNATELGEAVTTEEDAARAVASYEALLRRLHDDHLNANAAIKLTLVGLDLDRELAVSNMGRLLSLARDLGLTMRIDMEDSTHVEATLWTYRRLRGQGYDNVGAVLQSSLRRSRYDLEDLLPLAPNLRLVKGAYLEPREVAYAAKAEVDRNYELLMERSLLGPGYTAIATHDPRMIEHAVAFTTDHAIPRDRFEFQMLYGVRPQYQRELLHRGYTVMVATSYGTHWYPFFMRRLAERPANVVFLARNLLRR